MSFSQKAYAEDYWVFVRLEDRPGVTLDDDKGRSKRGDIIQIVPAVAGEEPTDKEKAEYAIYVVSDIALADKENYQESHWEQELDEYGDMIPVKKAFRNKKYNGILPGTKAGFYKDSRIKNVDFKQDITEKTPLDYLSYRIKSRFYAYAQRPMIRLANIITPKAYAADDINKICAVGPNCTDEDYNTLAAWEDANDGDLVTAATREIAEVYNDDGPLSGGVLIDGSTTNSSYYMVIRAPVGERHSGIAGTGVVINGDPSGESVIQLDDSYPRIEWIECDGSDNLDTSDSGCIGTTLYGGHLTGRQIKNVLVYDSVDHGIYITGIALLMNSFIYNNADTGVRSSYANDTLTVQNTTSFNNGVHGFFALNSDQNIDNCISMGNASLDFGESKGSGNFFNVDYSMSSDGTADNWSGTGVLINMTTADQFVSTSLPDLHLKAGSDAIDVGIDLGASSDEQIDIDGRDRDIEGDIWDMGADEFAGNNPEQERRILYIN